MVMQESGAELEEDDNLSWWDAAELIPVIGSCIGIVREWMATANVVMNAKGTMELTDRAIEQSYNGLKAIISKETGKIITITP